MSPEDLPGQMPVLTMDVQDRHLLVNIQQGSQHADALGCYHRPGSSRHAPAKDHDKDRLQDDIAGEGKGQDHRGHAAVPQGAHNIGHHQQEKGHHQQGKNDADKGVGIVNDFRRSLHPDKEIVAKAEGEHRHHRCNGQSQHHAGRRTLAHTLFILGPETLARIDGQTGGGPHGKAHDKEQQRPGTAHRRQSLHPQDAAHYQSVHKGVKLLENIASNQGQSKKENEPPGLTLCKILRACTHSKYLVIMARKVSCSTTALS